MTIATLGARSIPVLAAAGKGGAAAAEDVQGVPKDTASFSSKQIAAFKAIPAATKGSFIGTALGIAAAVAAHGGGLAGQIACTVGLVPLATCLGAQLGGNFGKAIGGLAGKTAGRWGERIGMVVGAAAGVALSVSLGASFGVSGGWLAVCGTALGIPLLSRMTRYLGAKMDAKAAAAAPPPAATETAKAATPQVVQTRSGLQYQDIVVGKGAVPKPGQEVLVHYTGWLTNGKKFDSSVDRGQPFPFHLGQGEVIPGWDEGLATMREGGKRKLTIPPDLAYGPEGRPPVIPPNSTLVFDVELLPNPIK